MELDDLARLLHIDSDEEKQNAGVYQKMAEQYLLNAGCTIDYEDGLFTGLVISMVAKMLTKPDLLDNLKEGEDLTFNGLIANCRLHQQVKQNG